MAEDDEQSLQVLAKVFAVVEVWRERIHADAPTPAAGSSLRKDDEATWPYCLSYAARGALLSAVDHFETLRVVVQEAETMPARAAFTLLRAALENAAIAVWLLAPANRNERVLRLLRLQWADVQDELQALELVGKPPPWTREQRKAELQELARAREMTQDQVSCVAATKISYGSIVKSAGGAVPDLTAERALLAWTLSSGIAHARSWAALSILDKFGDPVVDGDLVRVRLKASHRWVMIIAGIAAQMVDEAWRLLDQRGRSYLP